MIELHNLTHDEETDPGKLSVRIAAAREAVGIAARRLASAHAAYAEAQASQMEAQAHALRTQAEDKRAQAERVQNIAVGTVRGLFGDDFLTSIGNRNIRMRSVKALELEGEYAALVSQAEELAAAAASTRATAQCQAPARTDDRVTVARVTEMTPEQLASGIETFVYAALHGRIVEG